jgi:mono/diheme cytochrome c family protein
VFKYLLSFFGLIISGVLLLSTSSTEQKELVDKIDISEMPIEQILVNLGNEKYLHSLERYDVEKARIGEELVLNGRTIIDGKKSRRISTYFVCTDCHNLTNEFSSPTSQDPSDRLKTAEERGLPFLPGSTFWGIYNRTSFYNGDYVKKYGDMVSGARDSLTNAIQLCAEYCSSGRVLDEWEVEAIIHYYKKNELRLKDIQISENDYKNLLFYQKLKPEEKERLTKVVMNGYVQGYDATFLETMPKEERKYGERGNAENGKLIYNESCLFCHGDKRLTYLNLENDKLSGRMFYRNLKNYSDKSLYQIIRHGTYSKPGRKQYMPLYTKEKMSDEQLNDLVAYIKVLAKK